MKAFPSAFEYAKAKAQARNNDEDIWVVVAKEYQMLRVLPTVKPTGADLIQYSVSNKTNRDSALVYIALKKHVPDEIYESWYVGPPKDASSEIHSHNDADVLSLSDDSDDLQSSDYDPKKDPDADKLMEVEQVPGRYGTRIQPAASTRKRESVTREDSDSNEDFVAVKKQKLNRGIAYTAPNAVASSSRVDPLFLSNSDSDGPCFGSAPSLSAGPLQIRLSSASVSAALSTRSLPSKNRKSKSKK
ncbi:hypothetical protein B0H19DRAFT_1275542 [Mycena capillaripes]|nr:hypothetical protein B0H19DRAFT_1275542 [Mycena capillaripes]